MHRVLSLAFDRFIAEFEEVDGAMCRIHPVGRQYRWTIQQVVEHLRLSLQESREQLQATLKKGGLAARTRRTRIESLTQLMVLSIGHMPSGISSTAVNTPAKDLPLVTPRELADMLLGELNATDAVLDECRRRFGLERLGQHFLLGPMRVDQWRRYHVLHIRHHGAQIRRIRASIASERDGQQRPSARAPGRSSPAVSSPAHD
jgi:hypothetical protein